MSIKSKIKSAKTDDWLAEGLTDEEIKEAIKSAKAEKEERYKPGINTELNKDLVQQAHLYSQQKSIIHNKNRAELVFLSVLFFDITEEKAEAENYGHLDTHYHCGIYSLGSNSFSFLVA